jgi:hypothetical protein
MKPPRSAKPLPRYTRRKPLSGGRWAYFFEPPTWARRNGCTVAAEALGEDYAAAVHRVEDILLPALDSWRTGGRSDLVPVGPAVGTFDWLVSIFKSHRAWSDIDRKTKRLYEQGLALVADHVLKDGSRVGSKRIADFTRGFVDAIYAKLLVVEETDDRGNTVQRERRRFANAAMTACRRAWFVGQRADEQRVPQSNPFAKMGLKKRAAGEAPRETPTATWDELKAFRTKACELGHPSLATAALLTWEWLQREEHLFGTFEAGHYRPKERPDSVRILHPKNGEEAWIPLFDGAGRPLYPELMAELDELKKRIIGGLMIRRDQADRRSGVPVPWITQKGDLDYLRKTVKEIIRAAEMRDELSFTSFRHGGFTEAADADLTDAQMRALGRHRSARQLSTYAKRTRKQLITVAQRRRATRTNQGDLSE